MNIEEAKATLPLPDLFQVLGLEDHAKKSALCPLHDDHNASFSIFETPNGWRWKCFAGCGSGDEIEFLAKHEKIAPREAIQLFLQIAEQHGTPPKSADQTNVAVAEKDLTDEWKKCVEAITSGDLSELSTTRGYSIDFCKWLKASSLIGKFRGCFAFPIQREDGVVVGFHYRLDDGTWRVHGGCRIRPMVLGSPKKATVFAFESPWDAFAFWEQMGLYRSSAPISAIITRGAKNGRLVLRQS